MGGSPSRNRSEVKGQLSHWRGEELTDEGIGTEICQESDSVLTEQVSVSYWESQHQSLQGGAPPTPEPSAHPCCRLAEKW